MKKYELCNYSFFFILSRYSWIGDSFHDRLPFRSIDRSIDPRAGEYEGRDRATAGITRAGPEEVPSSRRSVFRQTSGPRSAGKSVFVDPKGETYLRERSRANLHDLENVIRARVPRSGFRLFAHAIVAACCIANADRAANWLEKSNAHMVIDFSHEGDHERERSRSYSRKVFSFTFLRQRTRILQVMLQIESVILPRWVFVFSFANLDFKIQNNSNYK